MDLLEGYGSQNQWEGRRAQLRGGKECFGMGYEWRGYIPKMVSFWRKWCEPVFPPYDTPPKIQSYSRKGIITLESFTPGWEVQCLDFWYHYDHTHWQEILPKEMKELKAMDAVVPKPTDFLYSKAETMAVVFGEKTKTKKEGPCGQKAAPFRSHLIRTRSCSVRRFTCCENSVVFFAPEKVLFTEVRPACNQSRLWSDEFSEASPSNTIL